MKQDHHGWWHPDFVGPMDTYERRALALMAALAECKAFECVVQAGGHVGTVVKLLASYFKRVITFEPECRNFECLVANVSHAEHVYPIRGALGGWRGSVGLALHSKGSGGHQTRGKGPVPCFRVDDLELESCDALFLDVEGTELHILYGARQTIVRHAPLIVVEENKQMLSVGYNYGDVEEYLKPFGYRVEMRIGEDLVMVAK